MHVCYRRFLRKIATACTFNELLKVITTALPTVLNLQVLWTSSLMHGFPTLSRHLYVYFSLATCYGNKNTLAYIVPLFNFKMSKNLFLKINNHC